MQTQNSNKEILKEIIFVSSVVQWSVVQIVSIVINDVGSISVILSLLMKWKWLIIYTVHGLVNISLLIKFSRFTI